MKNLEDVLKHLKKGIPIKSKILYYHIENQKEKIKEANSNLESSYGFTDNKMIEEFKTAVYLEQEKIKYLNLAVNTNYLNEINGVKDLTR